MEHGVECPFGLWTVIIPFSLPFIFPIFVYHMLCKFCYTIHHGMQHVFWVIILLETRGMILVKIFSFCNLPKTWHWFQKEKTWPHLPKTDNPSHFALNKVSILGESSKCSDNYLEALNAHGSCVDFLDINHFWPLPFGQSWGEKCCSYEETWFPEEFKVNYWIFLYFCILMKLHRHISIPLIISALCYTALLPWRSQMHFLGTNWLPLLIRASPLRGHSSRRRCLSKCSCIYEGSSVGPNAQLSSATHHCLKHPFPDNLGGGFKFLVWGAF